MSAKIKHIAVIRLSAMGDVAMTVPVLRAFADAYPDVHITMISRPFFRPFFIGIPNLTFFEFDANKRHHGFVGLLRLFLDLKKRNIDAFVDLHNVLRSSIVRNLFAISAAKTVKVDKARAEKKALTRSENKTFRQLSPITQRHANVFAALGFPLDLSNPIFPVAAKPTAEVLALTTQKEEKKWLGIAPFAQYNSKVYPADLMQQLIDALAKHPDYKLFLFGSKNEIEALNKFSQHRQNVIVVGGKLGLESELNLISNLDLMLSMDSGNAHIAAMLGIKVVTLWGATHPYAGFAPFNQPFENAIVADRGKFPLLPTSVYGNKVIPGYENAMRTIEPEQVIAKIESLLAK